MNRRTFTFVLLALASGPGATSGNETMHRPDLRLDAGDTEQELIRKLDLALNGAQVDELAARLTDMGARQVGVDIDRSSTRPVSAIFGLRRGWLKTDRRMRIYMDLTADDILGKVTETEFYAK